MVTWTSMFQRESDNSRKDRCAPESPTSTLEQCDVTAKGHVLKKKRNKRKSSAVEGNNKAPLGTRTLRSTQPDFDNHLRHCLTVEPTKEEFSRPFADYVGETFRKHHDCPCFKVVPPEGWKPRKEDYDFSEVKIGAPIKQHVFGRSGAYMCILEEQKSMNGAAYSAMASHPNRAPPARKNAGDVMMERSFWSSITMNPPIYGADTPLSLFDEKIPWGWNLRKLDCLFKEYNVPEIAGVTTPMTYFGMWKAFFAWHKEDLDLFSINYLHGGAPKVWYCVPPSESDKFDAMAKQLFPELVSDCPDFIRHKNIMISPSVLRSFNINYVQTLQRPGEFVVLNASAYHAGFNLGFNFAEAVNFALPEWLEIGKTCSQCECGALVDGVSLDMSIFFPGLYDSDSSEISGSDGQSSKMESESGLENVESTSGDSQEKEDESEECHEDECTSHENIESPKKRGRPKGSKNKIRKLVSPALMHSRFQPDEIDSSSHALPRESIHVTWGSVVDSKPMALVTKSENNERIFTLVHRLYRPASRPDSAWFGVLEQDQDGLYCPKGETILVQFGSSPLPKLVNIRVEWACPGTRRRGGWKLLSKASRIVM